MDEKLKPVSPGELLLEEFLLPMGITKYRLAKEIGVPAQRIGEIVAGRRAITADTDLRLCRFFGLSNGYWLRAQAAYDTEVAEEALADQLARIKPWSGVGCVRRGGSVQQADQADSPRRRRPHGRPARSQLIRGALVVPATSMGVLGSKSRASNHRSSARGTMRAWGEPSDMPPRAGH